MKTRANKPKPQKAWSRALWLVLGVTLLLLLVCVGVWLYHALARPETLFDASVVAFDADAGSDAPVEQVDQTVDYKPQASPEPGITERHIANILLLGLDMDDKPYAANGGDYHTDAMIVVAVNFDENTVDLISLPRDTFSRIPGYRGFYKLNAAINCGGGKTPEGFETCCRAAEWMLGGVSVDYYFALEMEAVRVIGDEIGGVDFDVDMSYYGAYGEYYKRGMQHLDGLGIYEYMRARTNATKNATDDGRMDRQKRMLLAMFEKLKQQRMLTTVPAIMQTVSDMSYTNLTAQQVVALANYAYGIDTGDVGMHTMTGERREVLSYVYTFPDQQNRVSIIREVYGADVPENTDCSYAAARWIQETGLYALRCTQIADGLYQQCRGQEQTREGAAALTGLYEALQLARDRYAAAEEARTAAADAELEEAVEALKACAQAAADAFGVAEPIDWDYKRSWHKDPNINEVMVDFR